MVFGCRAWVSSLTVSLVGPGRTSASRECAAFFQAGYWKGRCLALSETPLGRKHFKFLDKGLKRTDVTGSGDVQMEVFADPAGFVTILRTCVVFPLILPTQELVIVLHLDKGMGVSP